MQPPRQEFTLTDGRVVVRTPIPADAEAVAAAVTASRPELAPWMPWATAAYDREAALGWIMGRFDPSEAAFVITDDRGEVLGTCGLNLFDTANHRANLGYWLRSDATGRGIATAAAILVARHGAETLGLHRMEVLMSVRNEPSRRVAERMGAVHEGVLRGRLLLHGEFHDAHLYSIVA